MRCSATTSAPSASDTVNVRERVSERFLEVNDMNMEFRMLGTYVPSDKNVNFVKLPVVQQLGDQIFPYCAGGRIIIAFIFLTSIVDIILSGHIVIKGFQFLQSETFERMLDFTD